jgi:hypothetical protein
VQAIFAALLAAVFLAARRKGMAVSRLVLVGAAGFEPATFRSQSGCATRLRYAPRGFESSLTN